MLRELVAQPHCIHGYSSCKAAIKYVYTNGFFRTFVSVALFISSHIKSELQEYDLADGAYTNDHIFVTCC